MILAWVLSLILLCSSVILYLERMVALTMLEVKTMSSAQQAFMMAEKTAIDCEQNIAQLVSVAQSKCHLESAGKAIWKISTKEKPGIEMHIYFDEKTGQTRRLNWRQVLE